MDKQFMLNQLAQSVVEKCAAHGVSIATAESLTAGLCSATLAEIPGASAVLRGGLIVYSTDLKAELAGVSRELLEREGPICPDVAVALAEGAAQKCGATVGIGVTGVAGPDPQDGHPVGEIYVAVSLEGSGDSVQRHTEVRCIEDEVQSLRMKGALNGLEPAEQRARLRRLTVDCALFDTLRVVEKYYDSNSE